MADPIALLAVSCAVLVLVVLVVLTIGALRRRPWRRLAGRRGLTYEWRAGPILRGRIDDWDIRVEPTPDPETVRVTLVGTGRIPEDIRLTAGISEYVRTGDLRFDSEVAVTGNESQARAVLGARLRGALIGAIRGGLVLDYGLLELEVRRDHAAVDEAFDRLTHMAPLLALRGRDVTRRIGANAVTDPVSEVRRRNLEHLCRAYPDGADTAATLALARDDADPGVRGLARKHLA